MKRWWLALAPWVACLALLLASHWSVARGSLDDLATMYANAWLETCDAADAVPRLLQEHLAQHAGALSAEAHKRYSLRLDILGQNYPLLSFLLRLAARAELTGLRAVIAAALVSHLVVAAAVLAFMQRRQPWVLLALLVGGLASLPLYPYQATEFLPFNLKGMTWLCNMPRGATVLGWFGAMIALLFSTGKRRFAIAAALAVLSLLCHRAMALLCFLCTLPPLGLWLLLRSRLTWRLRPLALVGLFLGGALIVGAAKLALLLHYGSTSLAPISPGQLPGASALRGIFVLLAWATSTLTALLTWLRARASGSLSPEQQRGGDALAALVLVTASVALGANAFHADRALWNGPLYVVTEASQRLCAVANALVFALASLCYYALAPRQLPRATTVAALTALALSALQLHLYQPPVLPEAAPRLAALLRRGSGAYRREVDYFLSVAREVSTKGCAGLPSPTR
ncbi:MAG: hypothetical protein RL033_3320 [Pseudomonadota bacterium]|jgi:hypothetical protein